MDFPWEKVHSKKWIFLGKSPFQEMDFLGKSPFHRLSFCKFDEKLVFLEKVHSTI